MRVGERCVDLEVCVSGCSFSQKCIGSVSVKPLMGSSTQAEGARFRHPGSSAQWLGMHTLTHTHTHIHTTRLHHPLVSKTEILHPKLFSDLLIPTVPTQAFSFTLFPFRHILILKLWILHEVCWVVCVCVCTLNIFFKFHCKIKKFRWGKHRYRRTDEAEPSYC